MDLINMLTIIFSSVLVGIVSTLILQYYVLVRYFNKSPMVENPKKANVEAYTIPDALKKKLESQGNEVTGSSLPISLLMQFLFHELRHSDAIKSWLYRKLTVEFDELLTKTTIGKFFDAVTIRDMHLGSQFPDIKDITLESINFDKNEEYIDTLNLSIKLDYTGNFLLSVDAKMKFSKTAYLSINVKRVCGEARLQFSRSPYTHWSFSFYNEPLIELGVESHFQGRQLQSNITNLIVNQIKKAIKRKHTLPNYKIRYKPFFMKTDPGQLDADENEMLPLGQLEMSCAEVSRLALSPDVGNVYCTFTVDVLPFICVYQKENAWWMMLELTMMKVRQQQLGIIFKQDQNVVLIESVTPSTPAAIAGLKPGDVVLAVENKNVTNISQIGKVIKSINSVNISIKIERNATNYILRNKTLEKTDEKTPTISINDDDALLEPDSFVLIEKPEEPLEGNKKIKCIEKLKTDKVPKLISTSNENMSKFAQTIGNFTLRKRKTSVERNSNDSSNKSTPNPSCPSTPQHYKHLPTNFTVHKKHSISEMPEIKQIDPDNQETDLLQFTEIYKSKEMAISSIIGFNEEYSFNLKENCKYLNVNIWGTTNDKDILLGYTNIPLAEILNACCNSLLGHYTRTYSFLPPHSTPPNNQSHPLLSHSGFEHVFCYGDVLLSFVWNHDDTVEMKRKNSISVNDHEPKTNPKQINQHDFIRTQFHRSIHCDFCTKKIWLKDAVQCRDCGLCCHKKCIAKCQVSTDCIHGDKARDSDAHQQEIISVEGDDNLMDDEGNLDISSNLSMMKRVNSANNLSIPGSHIQSTQSRSLPPSPQRTPSRKQSLVAINPFLLCPAALEEIQSGQEASESVQRVLDQILVCATDENLMETARETGRQLYANIPQEEKVDKINLMMAELKNMFDAVTNEHAELCKKMNHEDAEVEKAKLAFLLGQADAKIHGLSVLMLHYCSGLQQMQENAV